MFVLALAGCVTTMSAEDCARQCRQRGMVMKGIQSTPTTIDQFGHDSCICGEPTRPATIEPKPPAPRGGCMKDTDCKGDRICEAGVCRAPAAE
jgi:hypothetical protein